jgi:hypothetical protein
MSLRTAVEQKRQQHQASAEGDDEPSRLKPILVTGAPRSGTTWVGQMLALSPAVNYIHEPFNPDSPPGAAICGVQFARYFTYVTDENESAYYAPIKRMMEGKYDAWRGLAGVRSVRGALETLRTWQTFATHRRRGGVPLIKDPIALMSAEWLARRFEMHCVVMIRHPAAFVASMKRLGWSAFPEKWALSQEPLMRDYLAPFEEQIRSLQSGEHDLIERTSLAWKLCHHVILQYQAKHRDWVFLRHEDISREPSDSFRHLYQRMGLNFSADIKRAIDEHTNGSNPQSASKDEKVFRLNSQANISAWKGRLSADEVARVRGHVGEVAERFYGDDDWR